MQKKIDIGQNAKINIVWNIKPNQYTKEEENSIKSLFSKKYGVPEKNIIIEKHFVTEKGNAEALNSENIKNIQDPTFQHKLFKQYLIENNIEDYNFDELVKIDSTINALIDYNQYEKSRNYKLKWIDWSNFLCYGENNHFDFTTLHGLVLLNGEPANKSGKSTFAYDLLHFLLFGKTKSGKANNLNELFNNYIPDATEMKVEGCINIDGKDYIIKRTVTRPAKSKKTVKTAKQTIEYFAVNEIGDREELVDVENLQEGSGQKTNKIIKDTIGNEKDFDLIISANAKDLDDLISLKEDERGKLLSRWIGLSCLEDKDIKAREMWNKKISVGRYCDIYNRETLKGEIATLEENNKELSERNQKVEGDISASVAKIEKYNAEKERYISGKKPVDMNLLKNGDVTTLESKLVKIKEDGINKAATLKNLKSESNTIKDTEYSNEEYQKLNKEKDSIVEKISNIKAEINQLKKKNEDLANSEYCPTCHRKYENVDNSGLIEENKKQIKTLIDEGVKLNTRKEEIVNRLSDLETIRQNQIQKNKIELKIAAIETELAQERLKYKEISDTIKKLNDNKEAIKWNNELDASINVVNESIKIEDNIRLRLNNELSENKGQIQNNLNSINDKKSIIVRIENEIEIEKNWKLYLKIIGKDGISKMVLKNTLPIINGEINNLLGDVSDFDVEITVNEKNDVDFWLIRNNVKYRLSAASGLEKTQAALALRVVLGKMSNLNKPPFVLFDEILGTVAKENYDDMKKLYDKILRNYDFILHICHIDLDWYNEGNIITVCKGKDNISYLKN